MSTPPFQLDTLNEQNLQVIQAYSNRAKTLKATLESFDGWLDRINELEEFEKAELVQIHGQLIAMGFLKFEISSGSIGLRYQVSTSGKNALARELARLESIANGDADDPEENGDDQYEELADAA